MNDQRLLQTALSVAKYRVVVKRPRNAPAINFSSNCSNVSNFKARELKPSSSVTGSGQRFDIYTSTAASDCGKL